MSNHDVLNEFIRRTGESEKIALRYLNRREWVLHSAMQIYQRDKIKGKIK